MDLQADVNSPWRILASTLTGSIGVAALRPSFTPTFTDKLKVTVQSILTGSDYSDLTKELTGPNLAKYKRHVDEMYDDFKSRVVEGREMHPDMIQHLAGGRVYTGQMAFDMLEEVNKNRPAVEDLPGTVRLPHSGAVSQQKQEAQAIAANKSPEGVQLAEGQEMSPFSVVEEPVEAADAISTGSAGAASLDSGPLGRGIVDGLGGIRDAAALAAEVYLVCYCVMLIDLLVDSLKALFQHGRPALWPHSSSKSQALRTRKRSRRFCPG